VGGDRITLRWILGRWCSWFVVMLNGSVRPPGSVAREVGRWTGSWVVASCRTGET
jgi:hypothetical protein